MKRFVSCSVAFVLMISASISQEIIYEDAVAVWTFSDLDDRAGKNSRLAKRGNVSLVELKGKDAIMSTQLGGQGRAAYFDGKSWLDAGQGLDDELNLYGREVTLYARARAEEVTGYSPILTKAGNDQNMAYSIAFNLVEGIVYIETKIGSDEIAGSHRLRYAVPETEKDAWQDIIFRFDGQSSQLYVNGKLRDDEVTVGQIRDWNRRPVLIGATYKKDYGYASVNDDALEDTFKGHVDIVALWNKTISDDDIMQLSQVDELTDGRPAYYTEKHRPQFHFTAKKNWLNDPNGLVYYDGVYHLFFQYMPPHRPGAYKDWGHAVSTDLVHWEQRSSHITPHKVWAGCWSGSAIVDVNNVAGFQTGDEKTLIAFVTNGGHPGSGLGPLNTQCIAYSTDGGETFTYYDQNPVLKHIKAANRDPKVVWDDDSKQYVMSLFMDEPDEFALFGSSDLKQWEHLSTISIKGVRECPGFEPLPVDGNFNNKKWLFFGANGDYVIGSFDGVNFMPETEVLYGDYGLNYYAAQTWSNTPDNRCVSIAWMPTLRYPGMPFEQQMTFPTEITLRTTPDGLKAFRYPVPEIQNLYDKTMSLKRQTIKGEKRLEELNEECYDMEFELDVTQTASFELVLRGVTLSYNSSTGTLACGGDPVSGTFPDQLVAKREGKDIDHRNNLGQAPLQPENGKIKLRILLDHNTVEIFGNDGEVVISSCFMPEDGPYTYAIRSEGSLGMKKADIHSLKSIWQ